MTCYANDATFAKWCASYRTIDVGIPTPLLQPRARTPFVCTGLLQQSVKAPCGGDASFERWCADLDAILVPVDERRIVVRRLPDLPSR